MRSGSVDVDVPEWEKGRHIKDGMAIEEVGYKEWQLSGD
jgi:hypothetical protein